MAQIAAQQQASVPPQQVISTPPTRLPRISVPSQGHRPSQSNPGRRTPQANNAGQNAAITALVNERESWTVKFGRVASICGILGFFLAVTFGAAQWVGQDRGNKIAKESELISLAFSCGDEKFNQTSICQQFLAKYPNGPQISPRGNIKQVVGATYSPAATSFIFQLLVYQITAYRVAWILLAASVIFLFRSEYGIFLLVGVYVCIIDPSLCWILLQARRLTNLLSCLYMNLSMASQGLLRWD
ncbi:hypothetical protein GGR51DRAFT_430758 [Nemania sp. FL0031]|nr:hypothetical protein GGR51DRAFT_430758 [Nemania sp. FL0031]